MRFSDRIGVTQPTQALHAEEMPHNIRVSLWNLFLDLYSDRHEKYWRMLASHVAKYFRKYPLDEMPIRNDACREWLKAYFFELPWHDAYNLLEFVVANHIAATRETIGGEVFSHSIPIREVESAVDRILERENSAYRFIGRVLSPITDKVEIAEVQSAATKLRESGLDGARKHLQTAIDLFSRRPNPDYRNAVKESISAIESIAKQLGSEEGDGLSVALRALADKTGMHGALRSAFEKLYGYSSDEGGIRHAMLEEPTVGLEEARYMIVACSAFANYMATKAEKAGLLA